MISPHVKVDVKQQNIKELVARFCHFLEKAPSKVECTISTDMHFSFSFASYSVQLDIVC